MSKLRSVALGVTLVVLAACGGEGSGTAGGEEGDAGVTQAADVTSMPQWMRVDETARTVALDIVAGSTDANNRWNFNGLVSGKATITVPEGYAVTINFRNADPAMAHSIGVSNQTSGFPPMYDNPQPVFAGAVSSNPTDAARATQPRASETIRFMASTAGEYSLVCYVPAHALSGMWIRFNVSASGEAGVTTR